MDSEGIMLSEMSDTERQIYDITYMWNLTIRQTSEYNNNKKKYRLRNKKPTSGYQVGRRKWGGAR